MLTIRQEQLETMQKIREEEQSIPALCSHLQEKYSYTALGKLTDQELSEQVHQAVAIARSYGLESKGDIYSFVTLELTRCPGFHQHPKVQTLLKDDRTHPNMRMLWIAQNLPFDVWAEVS